MRTTSPCREYAHTFNYKLIKNNNTYRHFAAATMLSCCSVSKSLIQLAVSSFLNTENISNIAKIKTAAQNVKKKKTRDKGTTFILLYSKTY